MKLPFILHMLGSVFFGVALASLPKELLFPGLWAFLGFTAIVAGVELKCIERKK